jgi:hypothetical protein
MTWGRAFKTLTLKNYLNTTRKTVWCYTQFYMTVKRLLQRI